MTVKKCKLLLAKGKKLETTVDYSRLESTVGYGSVDENTKNLPGERKLNIVEKYYLTKLLENVLQDVQELRTRIVNNQ